MPDKPAARREVAPTEKENSKRKIEGNLTYFVNPGSIKPVLEKIITASKPDKLTQDYMVNVFGLTGGTYRAVIPILKRVGFLTSDGSPTELYSKFRTESGRAEAVLGALQAGFAELFKKSEHVYASPDNKLTDLIVETTGLPKSDRIVSFIRQTFRIFSAYLPNNFSSVDIKGTAPQADSGSDLNSERERSASPLDKINQSNQALSLAYNIQIVLPETKDIDVYNIIFRSLRDNLLRQ